MISGEIDFSNNRKQTSETKDLSIHIGNSIDTKKGIAPPNMALQLTAWQSA